MQPHIYYNTYKELFLVNIKNMNIKETLKYLEKLKEKMPDIIIRDIKVGFFKHVYAIINQSVSGGDRVNDFILKYFSNKNIKGFMK